ncbi:MAG: glycosyltransferase family 4 protein [Vicinamibacterales bacterium]
MADRLRVAVTARAVYPAHGVGGLERHVFDLVRHLARANAEITLITRAGPTPASWGPEGRLVRVIAVPYLTFPFAGRRGTTILDRDTAYPVFGWRVGRRALELVRRGEIDVVYGLGASAFGYAAALGHDHTAGAPLVFNPQGLEEFGGTDPSAAALKRLAYWPLQRVVTFCAQRADCTIATDSVLEPVVRAHLGLAPSRIRVIPNAIDVDACDAFTSSPASRRLRAEATAAGGRVLLSVGRIEANKGFDVLAHALARLPAGLDWRWILVGDGPARPSLERMLASLGLERRVRLTGRVDDDVLHGWYEAADIFVHPTRYEGSSLVTLEAMAHRKPILATLAGGLPDKVRPGVNGWLVPPGDVEALAAALTEALVSPGLGTMGLASREIVDETFSWPHVTARMISVYKEVLASRRKESAAGGRFQGLRRA